MGNFSIGKHKIEFGQKLYFIADIAANHNGDLEHAFKLIELAKESGAHAAKFQNFHANNIVSKLGFDSPGIPHAHQSRWKKSVVEIYDEASISFDWTQKLKEKCQELQIEYFTSPYDFESVDHVDPYVNVYKIGSGDVTWHGIIEYIAKKGKPILIATGASTMNDVQMAMDLILKRTSDVVLMQCNTNYTAQRENFNFINLNVLKTYANLYPDIVLGLSDHTYGHTTVLGAIALGARVFEKHFTDDNDQDGPDHKFSMNPRTWREMVERAEELYMALGDGIKKIEDNERETAIVQRRCFRYTKSIKAGNVIMEEDIIPLRPRDPLGIPPFEAQKVIGMTLKRNVIIDNIVQWEDMEL